MDADTINVILNVVALALGGGLVGVVLMHLREGPKAQAAARKTEVETDGLVIASLSQRLGQVEERLAQAETKLHAVETENEALREDALKSRNREANLEQVVRSQKAHIGRLEKRVAGLERIFKLHPVTPEMQAEIDRLNQEDGGGK